MSLPAAAPRGSLVRRTTSRAYCGSTPSWSGTPATAPSPIRRHRLSLTCTRISELTIAPTKVGANTTPRDCRTCVFYRGGNTIRLDLQLAPDRCVVRGLLLAARFFLDAAGRETVR